jgi:nucleolar protein 14
LAYDARAKPKDRSKTEDELAVEEKDRLEKAEAKRLRRMRGEASEDEEGDEEGGGRGRGKRRKTEKKRGEADDLDDDFEEEELLGPGLTREDIENMEMDDGDEDEDEDEELSDMEDLNDEVPDLVEGDEADESGLVRKRHGKSASKPKPKTREIPYTFPCPADVEEFEDLLEGLGDEALPVVVQRIRALHHPSLAQGNKEKLQVGHKFSLRLPNPRPSSFHI